MQDSALGTLQIAGMQWAYRRLRNEALAEDTKAVRDEMNELLAQYRREKENAETR